MEFLTKLERKLLGWFRTLPNLPLAGQKWLADNAWWIVLIGAITTAISVLVSLAYINTLVAMSGTAAGSYYTSTQYTDWTIVTSTVSLIFSALGAILLGAAVQPLKQKQKKGWVLLFAAWLLNIVAIVVSGFLTLSLIGFIISILFGAVGVVVTGYFLIQIHGQFTHVERSRGVKKSK